MNILFVCTGNTCRSPMAAGLLRLMAEAENIALNAQSAGIAAFPGAPMAAHTDTILKERGLALEHASQQVTEELLGWADLVLTMTSGHKDVVGRHYPQALDKLFTLKEYVGWNGSLDVVDPFGGPLEAYRETERELVEALRLAIEKLKKQ